MVGWQPQRWADQQADGIDYSQGDLTTRTRAIPKLELAGVETSEMDRATYVGNILLIAHPLQHQLTRKREPDIRCCVLKNKPSRLECVAKPEDSAVVGSQSLAPGLQIRSQVFLEDVTSNYPTMSLSRLDTIPDDQILVFWVEIARFRVVPPVVMEGEPPEPWMDIRDPSVGDLVGSSRCYEDTPSNT